EEDGEEEAREGEQRIPEGDPDRMREVAAELDGDGAEDQEPEEDHDRKVKAAQGGGVHGGEGEEDRPAGGQEPDLVPVPHRPDRTEHRPALDVRTRHQEMDDAGAEIESVEDDVDG